MAAAIRLVSYEIARSGGARTKIGRAIASNFPDRSRNRNSPKLFSSGIRTDRRAPFAVLRPSQN